MNSNKRKQIAFVALLVLFMLLCCSTGLAEIRIMGNQKAGYLVTNDYYLSFTSVNVSEEDIKMAEERTGYCQYYCAEGVCSGMIITMQGYNQSQMLPDGTLLDNLNWLLQTYLSAADTHTYNQLEYNIQQFYLDEDSEIVLTAVNMIDAANPEFPNPMLLAILHNRYGNFACYQFETYPQTQEASDYIVNLLLTFHF